MFRRIKKIFRKIPSLLLLIFSILVGLTLAEAIVRLFNLDWRYMGRFLYYQKADLKAHQPDPNPNLRYRLRPGVHQCNNYTVTINSFGARGPERSASKPKGVFRIICVGGSNVYGAMLNDDQTWPAQLEAKLNSISPGRYEVWNFGVSAYVGSQMAILAEEAVERYDPDLIMLALSNVGIPAFLWGASMESYFKKYPDLRKFLFPEDILDYIPLISDNAKIWLVQNCRLFRFALLSIASISKLELYFQSQQIGQFYDAQNVASIRKFIEKYKERLPIIIFICPAKMCVESNFDEYYRDLNVPVLTFSAEGLPDEYAQIHPPPYVMTWYSEKIAEWLSKNHYLPERDITSR